MQSLMAASRLGYGPLAKLSQEIRPNLDLSKRGAALGRGPQALSKLPAAAWSNTWPAPASTLDLDFANNRGFVRGSGQGGAMDAVTFTRASSGNWVDNTGVLRTGAGTFTGTANALGNNLALVPQDFDNASWAKTGVTVGANLAAAPDNTITADTLLESAVSNSHFLNQAASYVLSTTYTVSVYAKLSSGSRILQIYPTFTTGGNSGGKYDLQNGTATTVAGTGSGSASISSVGNSWYRCVFTFTSQQTATSNIFIGLAQSTSDGLSVSYLGDGTSSVFLWGAQLEVGSSATTYYPTNINAPRFDWASTTQLPQNLLRYTEQFDNAAWTKNTGATITPDSTTAPDGNTTADTYTQSATPGTAAVYQSVTATSGQSFTVSVYVKKISSGAWVRIAADNLSTNYAACSFNLDTNTAGVAGANGSGWAVTSTSITSIGSGWYRLSVSGTFGNANPAFVLFISSADASGTRLANGSCYIWGSQFEISASPTTYQAQGAYLSTNTPLVANSTCNGLLIEESRTNRILWCRDGLNGGTAVGTNNFLYSEQFQQTAWTKENGAITADQTNSPIGTLTADLFVPNTTNTNHDIYNTTAISFGGAGQTTVSAYFKAAGYNYATLISVTAAIGIRYSVTIDLTTGAVTKTNSANSPTGVSYSVVDAGSGWWRISITQNSSATGNYGVLACSPTGTPTQDAGLNPTFAGDGTSGVYVWGAQIVPCAVLTDYQVTTTAAVANFWSKSNVAVAKTATGIDGVANAATTITASANNAVLIQPISLASGSRTGSVYLKRITGTGNVQVTLDGSTWSTVDLSNGLWNRIVLSGTVTNPTVGVLLATNGDAVAMDYAQVEDGAFVTSPILTTTATATRALDVGTLYFVNSGPTAGGYNTLTFSSVFTPLSTSASTGVSIRDSVGNTNFNNMILNQVGNGNYQMNVVFGSGASGAIVVTSPNGTISSAASYKNGFIIGAATGASGLRTGIAYGTGSWQPLINTLALTGGGVGGSANMRLKRVTVQPIFSSLDALTNLVSTNA